MTLNIGEARREVEPMLAKGLETKSLRQPLRALAERLGVRL